MYLRDVMRSTYDSVKIVSSSFFRCFWSRHSCVPLNKRKMPRHPWQMYASLDFCRPPGNSIMLVAAVLPYDTRRLREAKLLLLSRSPDSRRPSLVHSTQIFVCGNGCGKGGLCAITGGFTVAVVLRRRCGLAWREALSFALLLLNKPANMPTPVSYVPEHCPDISGPVALVSA